MRKRAHIQAKVAAAHFGVSPQALNMWENGVNSPSVGTIQKMAKLYGCTFDELLREGNDNEG